jgi:hypothetical protein
VPVPYRILHNCRENPRPHVGRHPGVGRTIKRAKQPFRAGERAFRAPAGAQRALSSHAQYGGADRYQGPLAHLGAKLVVSSAPALRRHRRRPEPRRQPLDRRPLGAS